MQSRRNRRTEDVAVEADGGTTVSWRGGERPGRRIESRGRGKLEMEVPGIRREVS